MSGKSSDSLDTARSRSPSRHRPAERRYRHDSIVCKPLDSLSDITEFLNDPPAWRSLCIELQPHSEYAIKNIDIVRQNHAGSDHEIELESPETFCHFALDKEDVRRHRRKDLPKTLVCHDMANGYHDDSNIDGTGNHEAYSFYNWAVVDIFCYFSHHFITIPPLGWINVAHGHGVKVMGTVITEWGDGAAIWERLLEDPEQWKGFACNLVAIAKTLKLDGWLLNVENQISKPAVLIELVRYLHTLMHSEMVEPVLLWYDSVTAQGHLAWQNGLTDNNKAFFAACDGIFTNYSWREDDVRASAAAAGARARDVFVGLDVWGRNFLGGGQFNTQQAVKIANKHGCSLAIFAPAWTHEAMEASPSPLCSFRLRELALWGSLWPFLATKLPSSLPFRTSFCTGQGTKRRLYGEVIGPVPWYNLRHQQYQPNAAVGPHGYLLTAETTPCQENSPNYQQPAKEVIAAEEFKNNGQDLVESNALESNTVLPLNALDEVPPPNVVVCETQTDRPQSKTVYQLHHVEDPACLELYLEDSFTGGGCLLVHPPENDQLIKLFHCDFLIEDTLIACVVTKTLPDHEEQFLNVLLSVDGGKRVVLVGSSGADAGVDALAVRPAAGRGFKAVQRYLLLHQPGFYVSVENAYGWKVRYYSVRLRGARVRGVGLAAGAGAGAPALLGHLGLCHKFENKD